jgi:crossover junction endodeoxyribonuclease RusA
LGSTNAPSVISFLLPVPPSSNHIWRVGKNGIYLSPTATQWREAANLAAIQQGLTRDCFRVPVHVAFELILGEGFRRGRDLNNLPKLLFDWLVAWGLLIDDSWEYVTSYEFRIGPREWTIPGNPAAIAVSIYPGD